MKHSIISWVLGASLMIAAPAAMADNNWKSNNEHKFNKHHAEKQHQRENKHRKKHWVKRHHRERHDDRLNNKRQNRYSWTSNRENRWNRPSGYNNNYSNNYGKNHSIAQRIYKRQDRQAHRINQGINKGQLVDREIRNLRKQQRRIAKRLKEFQYDGYLNRDEIRTINQMLDLASNNIRNKRHNRLTRASDYNRYPYGYPQDNQYEFVLNW